MQKQRTKDEIVQWLEREFTDRKVRGLNLTSACRLPLSRLGNLAVSQPSVIPKNPNPRNSVRLSGADPPRVCTFLYHSSDSPN
ncbi:hypothetical protein CSKR_108894 [Clonorchis sinensis]|uniref:Uncharacterized protein n=1 Tax=Clonorchis sinensis TaxID=79923 RepID=A0A3R7FJX4_CLOSI|nr:hypothetical protein CSKR_108894 [Clonorchis sinensis]